jgi:PleD family two-component response regulator
MAALNTLNTLHAVETAENSAAMPDKPKDEQVKKAGNILIIDPAAARRWNLLKVLGDIGNIYEASSTSEGLAILGRQPIDLVLLDLRAPELGAPNFCREVRNSAAMKFLQIFVVAESESLDSEVSAIEAGANQFLVAP